MAEGLPRVFYECMKANFSQPAAPPKPHFAASEPGNEDAVMKQAIAQEERRMSRHRGKSIKRPARIARSMTA